MVSIGFLIGVFTLKYLYSLHPRLNNGEVFIVVILRQHHYSHDCFVDTRRTNENKIGTTASIELNHKRPFITTLDQSSYVINRVTRLHTTTTRSIYNRCTIHRVTNLLTFAVGSYASSKKDTRVEVNKFIRDFVQN
jgi:hypothetical protein